jgi:hypothetical protein
VRAEGHARAARAAEGRPFSASTFVEPAPPPRLEYLVGATDAGAPSSYEPESPAVVATVAQLLEQITPSIEKELQPRLQGFLGSFVRAYLPQHWVFETEDDAATVLIAPTGVVSVSPGTVPSPDVTVHAPKSRLEKLLTTRTKPATMPTDVRVVPHTAKGKVAFDQVRGRFGL